MKFIHLSDLHLGKRVNGFSMLEEQKYILKEIIGIIEEEKPEAVLIAGDVYDRSVPPEEAVRLFDDFLVDLAKRKLDVIIISGNHDSEERVAYGGRLMDSSGIHLAPVYNGEIEAFEMEDAYGKVCFWQIPFLKPGNVRHFYPEEEITGYTDAMQLVISHMNLDPSVRNIALSHQFITGANICDSEEHSVGGLDDIAAEVYAPFDYVALGHLHGPQKVGRETIRYAGSPLKYSFSEAAQKKGVTIVELGAKGEIAVRLFPLLPMHDLLRISGTFEEIMAGPEKMEEYYEITLTDEEDIPNAITKLRVKYPRLMQLKYDNSRTRTDTTVIGAEDVEKKTPMELFRELYRQMNGQDISEAQEAYLSALMQEIWEESI